MIELRLPSFGADMDDAQFVRWNVVPGQALARGDIACVVETQKGAIDVEAWQAGTVARLVAKPGQHMPVGQLLAILAQEGEDWQAIAAAAASPPPTRAPSLAPVAAAPRKATPAARKRAAELGVDLSSLADSGRAVTLKDVESGPAQTHAQTPAQTMRAAIAAAMTRSNREIPHYYLGCEVQVDTPLRWLERLNAERPLAERILFAAVVLKAVALALREAPELNGHYRDDRFQPATAVHLGVVTALRGGGLVVPTVHDADRLPLPDLMVEMRQALDRARRGQLRSSDLADSTVTVSNLGDLGTDLVYGVIYPPQVALVGIGRVAQRPVARDGRVVAAPTVHLTLAADHRASDGLLGARFLGALTERLEHPEGL